LQVKQYVAVIRNALGRFRVFETGSGAHYLFVAIDANGCDHGVHVPVRKKDLRADVRRMLAHGVGNDCLPPEITPVLSPGSVRSDLTVSAWRDPSMLGGSAR
jgi:hypothetical protein